MNTEEVKNGEQNQQLNIIAVMHSIFDELMEMDKKLEIEMQSKFENGEMSAYGRIIGERIGIKDAAQVVKKYCA